MPTVFTHAIVGLGVAEICAPGPMPPLYWGLAAGLAALPDLDVIAFSFGIPYGALFGHRGFSHSLFCAALISLAVAVLSSGVLGVPWGLLGGIYFVAMASHGLLDTITNGGLGIALMSPFDRTRYFAPWRPVQVSMIGLGFFSRWGLRALRSEIAWIWIPTAVLVALVVFLRRG